MQAITKLGIYGGTFDPIHFGHLVVAEYVREACQLDQVIFVPSARPPHKDLEEVLDSYYRYAMVELAIEDNPHFTVSSLEIDRKGMSYTVETISAYQQKFPGVEIYFILGVDALLLMNTWKDVDHLAEICRFVVVTRPGYQLNRGDERFQGVPALMWEKMVVVSIPGHSISSSDVRKRIALGKTIRYLVPAVVEKYIEEHNLYRNEEKDHA